MSMFKKTYTLEKRKDEAIRIRSKYPNRIPVIVENVDKSTLPPLDKNKYLVPTDLTVGQFICVIRKRINLTSEQAIFLFINNTLPAHTSLMSTLYKEHVDSDGFIYITLSEESVFG